MSRRRLPPGARWVELPGGEQRIELVLDAGINPATGRRRQTRRRFRTVDEVHEAYDEVRSAVKSGGYAVRSSLTVAAMCEAWLSSRHGIRPTTLAGYCGAIKPVSRQLGALTVSRLDKSHVVALVADLQAGRLTKRPWKSRTVNLMLFVLRSVLDDAVKQGLVARNVAALVDRLPQERRELGTFTEALLAHALDTDLEQAWHLALYGLRRGEVAGLRWRDVDWTAGTLSVNQARVSVDGQAVVSTPKTTSGRRRLPLSDGLRDVLARAMERQSTEGEQAGDAYRSSGYVVVDALGRPLHPDTLTARWEVLTAGANVPRIRLHDARHTCGTLLHLQGVPTAVISAWLGHADAAFTMRVYVHSQPDVLADVARHFDRAR